MDDPLEELIRIILLLSLDQYDDLIIYAKEVLKSASIERQHEN